MNGGIPCYSLPHFICFYAWNVIWRSLRRRLDCLSRRVRIKVTTADVYNISNDVWCDQKSLERSSTNKEEEKCIFRRNKQLMFYFCLELYVVVGQFDETILFWPSRNIIILWSFLRRSEQVVITESSTFFSFFCIRFFFIFFRNFYIYFTR